jgi:uncharacterized protein (TIGR00730 family)
MNNRGTGFIKEDPWRVLRIMGEFVESFETLSHLNPAVTVFGSARTKPRDPYYKAAVELGRKLAHQNIPVVTGGGPGIMEAANKGAALGNGKSVGLNIELPHEQGGNQFANVPVNFHYFFSRKVCFVKYSFAFVFMPGGFGTLDELFETLTLVQTKKMRKPMPIVLFGTDYWNEVLNFDAMVRHGTISPEDVNLFYRTDSVEDAHDWLVKQLTEHALGRPGASL